MAELRFEWDPKKAAEKRRKHGVSFEEAESVFVDEFAILLDDPDQRLALQIACRARLTLGRPDTAAAGSRRA